MAPNRVRWLLASVLPQVGLTLIESKDRNDAQLVADDIATVVAAGVLTWGKYWALAGPAITYRGDGSGKVASDTPYICGEVPPVPPLDIEQPAAFAHEIQAAGGARLLVVAADDACPFPYPVYADRLRAIAEHLGCCVVVVACDLDAGDLLDALRSAADTALRVHRDGNAGVAEQTKGTSQAWTFTVTSFEADGEPAESIDDVEPFVSRPAIYPTTCSAALH